MIAIKEYTEQDNQFYPTPAHIVLKMQVLIDFKKVRSILEPSAGKGDILDALKDMLKLNKLNSPEYIDCVEIDPNLRAILKDKGYNVVGQDFLAYQSYTQYDLIIMNPPFKDGDKHLLKALEMCKNGGQVCCILNAETLRKPYTVYRQELSRKLDEYDAKIKYISNGFSAAERKTEVDTAIVYVDIPEKKYTFDLFETLIASDDYESIHNEYSHTQLATNDIISNVLRRYNDECKLGLELLNLYDRLDVLLPKSDKPFEHPLIELAVRSSEHEAEKLSKQNKYLRELRYKYWTILFQSQELSRLFTQEVREKLYKDMNRFRSYDFTLSNIKALQIELSANLSSNIEDAILQQFEKLTYTYSMGCSKNVHYFNGWKTNNAYMINRKVIIPCYDVFDRWGYWNEYRIYDKLDELEKCLTYLDGGKTEGMTIQEHKNRHYGKQKYCGEPLDLKYFRVEPKKKGTLHVWFKDLDLLKKFNIFGANKKGWLPDSYGKASYKNMSAEEKAVIDEFQGEKDYNETMENRNYYMALSTASMPQIGMVNARVMEIANDMNNVEEGS